MAGTVNITLVIATYNGQHTLPQTLNSINAIEIPDCVCFNLIVINNNSTDDTAKILQEFNYLFPVEILFQPKAGKNAALNCIFDPDVVLGDLLIFSDDDVVFPSNFLTIYFKLFSKHRDYGIFGGQVSALWPSIPSKNMLEGIDPVVAFAITPETAGYVEGEIDPIKLHGPNMAIVKNIFNDGLRFNENIGPNGGNYVMGSETDMLYQLKAKKIKAYYCTSLIVQHIIRPNQLTKKWLAGRAYKAGRSLVMHQTKSNQTIAAATFAGYPRWALIQRWKKLIRLLFCSKNSILGYKLLWQTNHLNGYCDEFKHYMDDTKK